MIILDMLHLKMVEEEEVDLVTLISQIIFQIYLKIFLAKVLEEEVEEKEDQIIGGQI